MSKIHLTRWAGVTATLLGLAAGPLHAATIDEDFESYTVGQSLGAQNSFYISASLISQDTTDPVNSSQVLAGGAQTADSLELTGRIQYQIDLNLSDTLDGDADGFTQLYLFGNTSNDRPLWVQFIHNRTHGNQVKVAQEGAAANFPVLASFETGKWYRLMATVYVDPDDGNKTMIEEIKLFELNAGGVLGDQVGQTLTNINPRGVATFVKTASIAHTNDTSGVYDNWKVVPEPASLSLISMTGLGLLTRPRKASGSDQL